MIKRAIRIVLTIKRYLATHPGKAVIGVTLADLLFAWPDALSWMVAAYLLVWAAGHLRQAFRALDAEPGPPTGAVEQQPLPAAADLLDLATALDVQAEHAAPPFRGPAAGLRQPV
jgi:hypothetical protein